MGLLLSKPRTDKLSEDGGGHEGISRFGLTAMQGWRRRMEDAHIANPEFSEHSSVYAVFDGHGGPAVSLWLKEHFESTFQNNLKLLKAELLGDEDAAALANGAADCDDVRNSVGSRKRPAPSVTPTDSPVNGVAHGDTSEVMRPRGTDGWRGWIKRGHWESYEDVEEPRVEPQDLPADIVVTCEALQLTFLQLDVLMCRQEGRRELGEIYRIAEKEYEEMARHEQRAARNLRNWQPAQRPVGIQPLRKADDPTQEAAAVVDFAEAAARRKALEEEAAMEKIMTEQRDTAEAAARRKALEEEAAMEKIMAEQRDTAEAAARRKALEEEAAMEKIMAEQEAVTRRTDEAVCAAERKESVENRMEAEGKRPCVVKIQPTAAGGQAGKEEVEVGGSMVSQLTPDGSTSQNAQPLEAKQLRPVSAKEEEENTDCSTTDCSVASSSVDDTDGDKVGEVGQGVDGNFQFAAAAHHLVKSECVSSERAADQIMDETHFHQYSSDTSVNQENRSNQGNLDRPAAVDSVGPEGATEAKECLDDGSAHPAVRHTDKLNPQDPECCGATAVVVVLTVSGGRPYLITANAGDSRAVLSRGGMAVCLSRDHKPELERERSRIVAAGGRIVCGRVDSNLNLSRCLGDVMYKSDVTLPPEDQKITAFPDVRVIELDKADEFVTLACDGIWDCLSSERLIEIVRDRVVNSPDKRKRERSCSFSSSESSLPQSEDEDCVESQPDDDRNRSPVVRGGRNVGADLSRVCEDVCDMCLARRPASGAQAGVGCDNMTLVVVEFGNLMAGSVPERDASTIATTLPALYMGRIYRRENRAMLSSSSLLSS